MEDDLFYLGLIRVGLFGVQPPVVLDVLEGLIHETAVASVVSPITTAVNQILFAQRHEATSLTEHLTLERTCKYQVVIGNV